MSPGISRETESQLTAELVPDSRQQPAWHVIVLGIFTCSIYIAYWAYKTARDLKRESIEVNGVPHDVLATEAGVRAARLRPLPPRNEVVRLDEHARDTLAGFSRISPLLRGIGVLIPGLNIYLLARMIIGIANLVPREDSLPRRHPFISTGLVLGSYLCFWPLAHLPGEAYFLSLLSLVPIAFAQHWLNEYWNHVESPDLLVRHGFSMTEMISIILGACLLGLAAAGMMIGVK